MPFLCAVTLLQPVLSNVNLNFSGNTWFLREVEFSLLLVCNIFVTIRDGLFDPLLQ
jgi:hypothetical protein